MEWRHMMPEDESHRAHTRSTQGGECRTLERQALALGLAMVLALGLAMVLALGGALV